MGLNPSPEDVMITFAGYFNHAMLEMARELNLAMPKEQPLEAKIAKL
jgi:hypothetical protein